AARNPLRARQARCRSPESSKRKVAQPFLEPVGQARRTAEDVERFVAVGAVVRLGCHVDVNGGALVEPPEEFGTAERLLPGGRTVPRRHINWLRLHEPVRLLPEAHLAGV